MAGVLLRGGETELAMTQQVEGEPRFICDAMLGGLARWLRAAGYSADFDVHFADGEIVRKALVQGKVLVTSDSGIMQRYAVGEGLARTVFVPAGLSVTAQLAHVLSELDLALRPSRCMDCDGTLRAATPDEIAEKAPEKVRGWCTEFFSCESCGKLFWHGTHWSGISSRLHEAQEQAETRKNRP